MEKIYFTLTEANSLLNFLTHGLNDVKSIKSKIAKIVKNIDKKGLSFEDIFANHTLTKEELAYRNQLEELGDEINDLIFEIEEKGPVVKDIDTGLIDFYSKIDGQDIFLCWKLGESEISHWHSTQEGFDARQTLFKRSILESVATVH